MTSTTRGGLGRPVSFLIPSWRSIMSDDTRQPDITETSADWQVKANEHARLAPGNKAAVFDALARAGITSVLIQFDGCGDSGQIENIDVVAGDTPIELPNNQIEFAKPVFDSGTVERSTVTLRDAIETLVYDFLEETHGSWEDNDGAYGEFTFDVGNRTLTLAYNERHMESDYSEHVF
jgi:hypothetical protein